MVLPSEFLLQLIVTMIDAYWVLFKYLNESSRLIAGRALILQSFPLRYPYLFIHQQVKLIYFSNPWI